MSSQAQNVSPGWRERLSDRLGERAFAVIVTILLEALLLTALITLGMYEPEQEVAEMVSISTFDASQAADEPASEPEQDEQQQAAQPTPVQPQAEQPRPAPLVIVPIPRPSTTPAPIEPPQPTQQPAPAESTIRAVIRNDGNIGPSSAGNRGSGSDSAVVGTAPDGSPLYAARWFREPTRQEMAGYLSTVEPPAWALIACRTAPRWEVVDCEPIEQYPPNSNIMNAVLASTWQYQVRPPRRGNRSLVGSWVRIRISYGIGG